MEIIDAWAQHPTPRHLADPIFGSLRRWTRQEDPDPEAEIPLSLTLDAMQRGGVARALISAWYRARTINHFANHTRFENARFRGGLSAGGLIWLAVPEEGDAAASAIREAIASMPAAGGHATLIRAADATRETVPVYQPQPDALAALTKRVKESFDPKRVLNPGRMYEGV